MAKTIREHLEDLDHPTIRARALANLWWEDAGTKKETLATALYQAFNWARSPEGPAYWYNVYHAINAGKELTYYFKVDAKNLDV
jgi:hypothetical protein